ncbi:hypothetical protein OS190_06305 [Sulfitobacter sp. F26204]|uniref:hypothetical protein n=1 Tax=Sulfitobacter sp. F26204 TaxID=2996014 RepID=UPI00225E3622|nr:hypothetical protein [Sulfitobacter sp. F26204]MCX7559175.1 hypothetical protein [Sulfitobacter sp. F26204]
MSGYNSTFQLTVDDMELIEEALRAHARELSMQKLVNPDANAERAKTNREIEENLRKGEALLGRLHDQKIFYRPKSDVYVSG